MCCDWDINNKPANQLVFQKKLIFVCEGKERERKHLIITLFKWFNNDLTASKKNKVVNHKCKKAPTEKRRRNNNYWYTSLAIYVCRSSFTLFKDQLEGQTWRMRTFFLFNWGHFVWYFGSPSIGCLREAKIMFKKGVKVRKTRYLKALKSPGNTQFWSKFILSEPLLS